MYNFHRMCIYLLVLFLAVIGYGLHSLYGQETEEKRKPISINRIFGPLETKERLLLEESMQLLPLKIFPMEGYVDPKTYVVGPGDILLISLWGEIEGNILANVYPQGNIILPTLGSIDVRDMTLARVGQEVKEHTKKIYPASEVTISLYSIRQFVVHVTGEVAQKGEITVTAISRIAAAIKMAGGVTNWADKRQIQVTHLDGEAEVFDLFEYEREGNMAKNPLLRDGDVIYVPRLTLSKGRVFVEGNIGNPGYYQFYEGESLSEFLRRINLEKETTDWEQAYIERSSPSGEVRKISLPSDMTESNPGQEIAKEFSLHDNDRFFLPKKIDQVFVHGAVRQPGSYPFAVNMKAVDYVGMAGRSEKSGGYKAIKVIRRRDGSTANGGDTIVERGDIIVLPLKKSATLLEYLQFVAPVTSLIITAAAVGVIKISN